MILSRPASDSDSNLDILGSLELWELYKTNFFWLLSSLYSALSAIALLFWSWYEHFTYVSVIWLAADVYQVSAMTQSFSATGPNKSPSASACNLGAKSSRYTLR